MKKFLNKKIPCLILLIALMFTVVAYAYSESVGGSITEDGDDVIFNAHVSTSLNPSDLNRIELYHEGSWMDTVLFRYGATDRFQYYNEFTHETTEEDAADGVYTSLAVGEIDYVHPNYPDFFDTDESEIIHGDSYLMYKTIAKQRLDKKNEEAAESFKIDLNSYTEISRDNPAFKKDLLFLLCPQVEATRGDSIPTIFLDGTNNSGVVLKQDKNGVSYKYSFVKQEDRWEVINKEVSQ